MDDPIDAINDWFGLISYYLLQPLFSVSGIDSYILSTALSEEASFIITMQNYDTLVTEV